MTTQAAHDIVDFARGLRSQGLHGEAGALLEAALSQPELLASDDPVDILRVAWIRMELGHLHADRGLVAVAAQRAMEALAGFEAIADGAGAATACLLLGDLQWLSAEPAQAASLWSRGRALADQAGAHVLAARALLCLAIREIRDGEESVVEGLLRAAETRQAQEEPQGPDGVRQQLALRVSVAVVRAARAVTAQRFAEAQLLLATAADAARQVGELSLYVACLRVDAQLARRGGDPHGAVLGLTRALAVAEHAGLGLVAAALQVELGLAYIEDEDWPAATALLQQLAAEQELGLPDLQAAKLELSAVLSHRGGRPDQAIEQWRMAAALRQGDHGAWCRTACGLGEALLAAGKPTEAREVLAQASAVAASLGRPELAVGPELGLQQVDLLIGRADPRRGAALVMAAAKAGSTAQQLAALDALVATHLAAQEPDAALQTARQQAAMADAQPLVRWRARSLARLSQAQCASGDASGALLTARAAAERALQAGDADGQLRALLAAGDALRAAGRPDEALLAWSQVSSAAQGAPQLLALVDQATLRAAELSAQQGDFPAAGALFEACRAAATGRSDAAAAVASLRGLAWCARELGDLPAALQALRQAAEIARQVGGSWVLAIETEAAQAELLAGKPERALRLEKLADLEGTSRADRAEALAVCAHAHARSRAWAQADALAQAAVQLRRQGTDVRALGAALYLAGQTSVQQGQGERAGRQLGEALVLATGLGLPEQARIRHTIDQLTAAAHGSPPARALGTDRRNK